MQYTKNTEYDEMLQCTLNDIEREDLQEVQDQLNETLDREGKSRIKTFEFDGCEDVNVTTEDGQVFEISGTETTMDELLQEMGL